MANLRDMIDNKTIVAAGIAPPMPAPTAAPSAPPPGNVKPKFGKPPKGGSPMANHIAQHMSDPLGATKEGFSKLTKAKLEYDQQREEMQRNLAAPQSVIDHVSQIHGLLPGGMPGQVPTPGMTPAQPQVDPMTGQPMQGQPGQDPNNPGQNDNPELDDFGNPVNMGQTTGKMNQNRPSMAGHQPGVAPGPQQSVVPGKMGMPKPGGMQQNKPAAKPKGAGTMPGAKGPGDPKVASKNNKAQSNSSRQIKIHVAASNAVGVMKAGHTIETQLGLDTLRAAGTTQGAKKHWSVRNKGPLSSKEKKAHFGTMDSVGAGVGMGKGGGALPSRMYAKKKMKAGPAQLSDKVSDPGTNLAYNAKFNASGKCMKCGKKHIGACSTGMKN